MHLKDFIEKSKFNRSGFAKKFGFTNPSLSHYINGKRYPGAFVMAKIIVATGGKVKPNDMYEAFLRARNLSNEEAASLSDCGDSPVVAAETTLPKP